MLENYNFIGTQYLSYAKESTI